ncbi:MAG: TonB-dependent receptor [Rikenellaceae bacterium]
MPLMALAQQIELSGSILDEGGSPVIGATIIEKGTTRGAMSLGDGSYTLKIEPNSTIVVSFFGYIQQEIAVNNRTKIDVVLQEDAMQLDEVVVVGYGTMKKSDLTGAVSSVDVEELTKRATTNPAEALQGKVAGVSIQKTGGNAGADVEVKIRGVKTFGDNQPLYMIDGFPGDIANVNPQDIESMEVLKDGAAAAIYGSVAANGVVLITTKNGKKGETKIDFSSYLSVVSVSNTLDLLDADEYKEVHAQMYNNWNSHVESHQSQYDPSGTGAWTSKLISLPEYITKDTGVNTDWQDEMMRTGLSQNYMVSLRGGSDNSQYSVSYNHADDKGIFLGNNYTQDNARVKLAASKSIFDFDANLAFKMSESQQPQYSLKEMYMISPLVSVYDDSNEYGFGLTNFDGLPNNRNVAADNYYETASTKNYNTSANIAINANIAEWLDFRTSYSYRGNHSRYTYHAPDYVADEKSYREYPYYAETTSYWEEQVLDNVLTFNKEYGKHSINAMAGTSVTAQKYTWNSIGVEGKTTVYSVENGSLVVGESAGGFLDSSFDTIGAGVGGTYNADGSRYTYNRASFFGRLNYNYDDRFLVQATMRYDGSSKFGSSNRWGSFPSVALGWRISEEDFFNKEGLISNLKLRASWGVLGNENALGYYDFLALINTYNTKYQGYVQGTGENAWTGSIATGLENRSLQWETTETKNIGLDYGLFRNKLTGTLNYYYNKTTDLLITRVLAPSAGLDDPILNVGSMKNSGFEFEANWNDTKGEFGYSAGINLATTDNKVLSLANDDQVIYGTGLKYGTEHFPTQTMVGAPIGGFYLYRTDGLFQSDAEVQQHVNSSGELLQPYADAGDVRFVDLNGDGVIDENDKEYCGSGIPKLEVNLNLSANYKNFDFSAVIGSAWGYEIYNANEYFYESMSSGSNFLASSLDAWTPTNTDTDVPRAIYGDPNSNSRESDRFLENGDFVRLRQIQLGYTLPKSVSAKLGIERFRVYASGENLLTITGYTGVDPEFSTSSVLDIGVDNLVYPFTRSYIFGVQLTF